LPVITTQYNGASELLSPPNDGLVIDDPHDAPALAAAMSRMLDSGYRSAASQAARQAAGRWTFEHHYRALVDVFREVRSNKRAA
jgi:UDP-glucose:(heptosyl)LPS alpha-1,3-glucosyltransferase